LLPALAAACTAAEPPANVTESEVVKELAQVRIEPGLWERSSAIVDVDAQAAPRELVNRMMQRRTSARHCITPEQAARPTANFMAARENAQCVSRSFDMHNGRISGEMDCTDAESGGKWTARMQGSYTPVGYELEMIMEMPNPWDPGQMLITSRTQGRRLGACEGPQPKSGKSPA
jgi:hypothetical protein